MHPAFGQVPPYHRSSTRHVESGERVVDDGVPGSRTDDDKIVMAHPATLRGPPPSRRPGTLSPTDRDAEGRAHTIAPKRAGP